MCLKPYKDVGTEFLKLAECVRGPVAVPLAPKSLFFRENIGFSCAYSPGRVFSASLGYECSV